MKFTINNVCGNVMYEVEADSFLNAVERKRANLWGANLGGANLWGANLRGANLGGANLWGANLRGANLTGANLWGANLRGANLWDAILGGANLGEANLRGANLRGADLGGANLWDANLGGADLWDANLRGANLRGADLGGADLGEANLWDANLGYANFRGAKNISRYLTTPLYLLLDQPGKIRAYKLINKQGEGTFNGGINYLKTKYFSTQANMNEQEQCGAGINLATLDWCMKEWREGDSILIMEFTAKRKDGTPNICVPVGSDGKFRVWDCKRVGEKDLKKLGLEK